MLVENFTPRTLIYAQNYPKIEYETACRQYVQGICNISEFYV